VDYLPDFNPDETFGINDSILYMEDKPGLFRHIGPLIIVSGESLDSIY